MLSLLLVSCKKEDTSNKNENETTTEINVEETSVLETRRVEERHINLSFETPMIKVEDKSYMNLFLSEPEELSEGEIYNAPKVEDYVDYDLYMGLIKVDLYNVIVEPYLESTYNIEGVEIYPYFETDIIHNDYMKDCYYISFSLLVEKNTPLDNMVFTVKDTEQEVTGELPLQSSEEVKISNSSEIHFNEPTYMNFKDGRYVVIFYSPIIATDYVEKDGLKADCVEWNIWYLKESATHTYDDIMEYTSFLNDNSSTEPQENKLQLEGVCILGKTNNKGLMHINSWYTDYEQSLSNNMEVQILDKVLNVGEIYVEVG